MRFQLKQIAIAGMLTCLGASAMATTYFYVQPKSMEMAKVAPFTVTLGAATLPAAVRGVAYNGSGYNLAPLATVSGDPALNQVLVTFALTSGALPAGMVLSSAGVLAGTPTVVSSNTMEVTATYKNVTGAQSYTLAVAEPIPVGQIAYTTPGTFSFVAPAGVTAVSVVAVGGGAGGTNGMTSPGGSGGGGGLGWANTIAVVPGQSYILVVGVGGAGGIWANGNAGKPGGVSYFSSPAIVAGYGGSDNSGGAFVGAGGGKGGSSKTSGYLDGGGGAGGYSGTGGSGLGGSAANGSFGGAHSAGGGGGGVGLMGQGVSGVFAAGATDVGGSGGSGGAAGGNAGPANFMAGTGGGFGGGGGYSSYVEGGAGGSGAVRIIWGPGRAFPSTLTTDQ